MSDPVPIPTLPIDRRQSLVAAGTLHALADPEILVRSRMGG